MQRIFDAVNAGVKVREWGMGKICNPKGPTAWPDRLYNSIPFVNIRPRKPGRYTVDGKPNERLYRTGESIHPSARIRYQYRGKGLDDANDWPCRALIENGYYLSKKEGRVETRPFRVHDAINPYQMVLCKVLPYFDIPDKHHANACLPLVRTHQPREDDLHVLDDLTGYWVWKSADGTQDLPEEHIGIWERMFIKTNEKLLEWQRDDQKKVEVTRYVARTAKTEAEHAQIPREYGYHNIISWQRADTTKNDTLW